MRFSCNATAIGFCTGWSGTRRTRPCRLAAPVGLAPVGHGPRTSGRETAAPKRTASGIWIDLRHFDPNASDPRR